ncbi:hypothetical protein [Phenylobacterium ferrooxidans]|uniref:Uncharacterized protein n=1 Tax=Phenylobacterium ferrooxidans TaxID=2982689 RepID=A0ABW6CKC8_9CAUL
MADNLSIGVDLSDLAQVGAIVRQGMFSNLEAAVARVAATGVERWQQAAHAAPLWQGERDAYMASITSKQLGPLSWEIVSNYKYVEDIETGRPPRDLKKMLDTSLKVRLSAKGVRYLIIPFRHNTPGNTAHAPAMPREIHQSAQELSPSRITGQGTRQSGTGAFDMATRKPITVRTRKYLWGGRLEAQPEYKLKASHRSDPYAGMVKFSTKTPGGKSYSNFLTFRVMTANSSGWIVPAKPGLFLARAVADSLRRTAELDFSAAISLDLASAA